MHHFADDRAGPDDGHLHHDVVKRARLHARQAGHLRAAFHLKHADGVGLLQGGENGGIVLRQMRQVHWLAVGFGNQLEAVFQHGHHAEAQQIHFDDAHVGAVFLVPLHHHAAGHGGGFEGHDGIQAPLADHHASGMLAEVARQVLRHAVELEKFAHARMVQVKAGLRELALARILGVFPFPVMHEAGELFERGDFEAQRLAHFARGGTAAIGDDVGGHGGA